MSHRGKVTLTSKSVNYPVTFIWRHAERYLGLKISRRAIKRQLGKLRKEAVK